MGKGEAGVVERGENSSLGGGDLKKEKVREERSGSLGLEKGRDGRLAALSMALSLASRISVSLSWW